MLTGAPDLDDVARLQAADVDGRLRLAAMTGAQVRAVDEAVREGVLAPLVDLRPRAVVLVVGGASASAAADLVVTTMAARIDVPLVVAGSLPGWIGPLDLVVLMGDDAGDMTFADAAARATRRRAELVVDVPLEGPLREAAGGSALDLSPRVPTPPEFRFVGHVVALLAVLGSLTTVRSTGPRVDLGALAQALDDEAAAAHPGNEVFHNAAKGLAARVADRSVAWAGDTPASTVIAGHAARSMYTIAGVSGVGCDLAQAVAGAAGRPVDTSGAPVDSIFHDPEFDGPVERPVRVQVITTPSSEWSVQQRISILPDADVVAIAGPAPRMPEPGRPDEVGDTPDDLVHLLVLSLRIEMAAIYLRLTGAR
ncbi:hypothetical protein [Williamsia sp.]|uniref:hypothetical protein n=1 Tax=Williamsia sp. TaxID=1872085 RepID=UPI001A1BD825|nr:hypothetical protein [Williamsia sp.]MBJ7289865.1 hypothetical protein [Williamsia sp.]